jgi:hypothetical protein
MSRQLQPGAVRLDSVEHVLDALQDAVARVATGQMSPEAGRSVGRLAEVARRALRAKALGRRLAALEAAVRRLQAARRDCRGPQASE